MQQKQFIETGKGKLPVTILKWIWKNIDKLDDIIALIISLKRSKAPEVQTMSGSCGNVPRPKNQLTPNGDWECIGGNWTWVEGLG
jgi:hypothetical protein